MTTRWIDLILLLNQLDVFVGELNELVREKDLLALEKKCEHHATETAMNNAREMQKQAAKSAKDAGKNKGKSVILYLFNLSVEWRGTCRVSLKKEGRRRNKIKRVFLSEISLSWISDTCAPLPKNIYSHPSLYSLFLRFPPPPFFPRSQKNNWLVFLPGIQQSVYRRTSLVSFLSRNLFTVFLFPCDALEASCDKTANCCRSWGGSHRRG